MTILIGAIHDGVAYIGADSLWTWDEQFVRVHKSSKFADLANQNVLIATAGQDKFTQILEKILKTESKLLDFEDKDGIYELVDAIQVEAVKHGVGEPENNQLPNHDLGFLIASSNTDKIWCIEPDYGVTCFDDHICTGSGAFLGESAMLALSKKGIFGEEAIRIAIETVSALHPFCGGPIEIRSVKIKGEKNE